MRKILLPIILLASAGVGVLLWNQTMLQSPLNRVLDDDPRNEGVQAKAHYGAYVKHGELVFDLQTVGGDKAPVDIFRVLLQFSATLQDQRFDRVILAHRGTNKFQLDGTYFQQLGQEYSTQNPAFTMRTFPEHVSHLDGSPAFSQWSGGLLGVMGKQMEDFYDFHRQWYIDDISG